MPGVGYSNLRKELGGCYKNQRMIWKADEVSIAVDDVAGMEVGIWNVRVVSM